MGPGRTAFIPCLNGGPALVLLLAAGCIDFYPEDTGGPSVHPQTTACQTEIWVPTGNLPGQPLPATPHQASLGAAPTPYSVHLGIPERDLSRSVSMVWNTDTATLSSLVEFGPADGFPDNAEQVEGASFLYGGGVVGEGPNRVHEVRLCERLTPGTTYSYRVGGQGAWSPIYSFTTPGAPGSFSSFRVAMAGDSRGAYATWASLLAAMDSHQPDLILFSGDMVELGVNQEEWDRWFEATGDILARRILVPAHGNHEFLAQHYFALWSLPEPEEYFAVDWGDALILALNDTVRDSNSISTTQAQFLERELAASAAPTRIALHHQPAYSTCTTHGSDLDLRLDWSPIFENNGVDFVLAGHNHIYERSVPIANGRQVEPGQGTVYLVSGGAGAPLYTNVEGEWFGAVASPQEHYIIADFGPDSIEFVVRGLSGEVIDRFSLPR